ncbi:unnamed protein product [Chrysoparadoxa australica]
MRVLLFLCFLMSASCFSHSPSGVHIGKGQVDDVLEIRDTINVAFQADAYFKKPEYYNRISQDCSQVHTMMKSSTGCFLVAKEQGKGGKMMGCLYTYWSSEKEGRKEPLGSCSHVAVLPDYEGRGIGRALIRAAEKVCCLELGVGDGGLLLMEIPVINSRTTVPLHPLSTIKTLVPRAPLPSTRPALRSNRSTSSIYFFDLWKGNRT